MKNGLFAFRAYAIAFLLLLAGAAISLRFSDWQWFARSGSLVVLTGIILTSQQIIEHMRQLTRMQRNVDRHCNRDWARDEKHATLYDDHEARWASERCGLYLLIIGTFVWGFGDLLGKFV